MKATEMKVTYIDPDMRQLFVEKLPDGGYGVWSQKDKHAPRKLMAAPSERTDTKRLRMRSMHWTSMCQTSGTAGRAMQAGKCL